MIDVVIAASLSEVLAANYLKKQAATVATSAGVVVVGGLAVSGAISLTNSNKNDSK